MIEAQEKLPTLNDFIIAINNKLSEGFILRVKHFGNLREKTCCAVTALYPNFPDDESQILDTFLTGVWCGFDQLPMDPNVGYSKYRISGYNIGKELRNIFSNLIAR